MARFDSKNGITRATWVAALMAAGVGGWLGGCKKKPAAAPTYTLPASTTMPVSADDALLQQQQKILTELNSFPPLGEGVLTKLPTGEVWVKYSCGIMVQDLRPKDEIPPKFGQFVTISYTEYLSDADARFGRIVRQQKENEPLKFRLGSKTVITGLSMGLSTMKPETRRRIFIPPELAYGEKGDSQAGIGPNQPVIYDVELITVNGDALPNLPPEPGFIGPPAPKDNAPPPAAP